MPHPLPPSPMFFQAFQIFKDWWGMRWCVVVHPPRVGWPNVLTCDLKSSCNPYSRWHYGRLIYESSVTSLPPPLTKHPYLPPSQVEGTRSGGRGVEFICVYIFEYIHLHAPPPPTQARRGPSQYLARLYRRPVREAVLRLLPEDIEAKLARSREYRSQVNAVPNFLWGHTTATAALERMHYTSETYPRAIL